MREFKNQTLQNFRVNLWNNSSQTLDIGDFPKNRVQIINSKENLGSQARFFLVPKTTGNPIIFLDDDEVLDLDFVRYYFDQYNRFGTKCILGWWAKIFKTESYWENTFPDFYKEADYIGTAGMILDREIFDKEPLLQNIPKEYAKCEDLYLCYLARMKYEMQLIRIKPHCKMIIDGKDQWKSIIHYNSRAFSSLRKKGWKLLREKTR